MANPLNDFLGDEPKEEPVAAVVAEPAPELVAAPEDAAPAEPTEVVAPEPPEAPGKQVPVAALQAERRERQDWKEKANRYEGELAAIKAQLEEMKKAPVAPPKPAAPAAEAPRAPDPNTDPAGYAQYQAHMIAEQQAFNNRLELTEDLLREKEGDEAVDKAVAAFKEMANADPSLGAKLRTQRNPYRWMFNEVKRQADMKEIGPDPKAWAEAERTRIRAELQAELAGGGAVQQRPVAAQPELSPSLANVRSAGTRMAEAEVVPEFDAIFDRKKK